MTRPPLVVVGDLALDREVSGTVDRLCPEAPVPVLTETEVLDRPGEAGLAALFARLPAGPVAGGVGGPARPHLGRPHRSQPGRPPREVILIAAVGADAAGDRLRELLADSGVRLIGLTLLGQTPEHIRMRAGDHLVMRLDRGGPADVGHAPDAAIDAIRSAGAVLVSDRGRGVAAHPAVRAALSERAHGVPVVWDPHPLGGPPVAASRLVTPDRAAAGDLTTAAPVSVPPAAHVVSTSRRRPAGPDDGELAAAAELAAVAAAAVRLRRYWAANAVAVTVPGRGAVLSDGVQPPMLVPVPVRTRGDRAGSRDRFAAAAVAALADGLPVIDAVTTGVTAAAALAAAGGIVAFCPELYDRTRAPGRPGSIDASLSEAKSGG